MVDIDERPTYNLKVVIQETGVKADTLRAWERRYGLPTPARSEGRHRLYSQHDIDTLHWLVERQDEGMSISRAVKLWKRILSEGDDPLEKMPLQREQEETPDSDPLTIVPASSALSDLRNAWVKACLEFDETTAEHLTTQAFAIFPAETVCFDLLLAGLGTIGEAWYQSNASVQQEHFASALVVRRLNALIAAAPPPTRNATIVIGCPPGEDHTLAPLMLTLTLRQRGWRVVYLGADVPIARFKSTLQNIRPVLVIMIAQLLHTAAPLAEASQELADLNTPLAFGGRIFNYLPKLTQTIPGYFLGEDLRNAGQVVEQILQEGNGRKPAKRAVEPSFEISPALEHYRQKRGQLETIINTELADSNLPYEYLLIANHNIAADIDAALRLGSLDFLGHQLEWLRDLMVYRQVPPVALKYYLQSYLDAARQVLDERGQPILQWLADVIEANGFSDTPKTDRK